MPGSKTLILNHLQIQQRINRIAYQVYENNYREQEIIIAGIVKNGFVLAKKISEKLQQISPIKVKLAEITLNKKNPLAEKVKVTLPAKVPIDIGIENKVVIVVDDVLESGKTMMYGIAPLLNYPLKHLYTIVLIDRDHRIFPIKADFVGLSLATTMQEHVSVEFNNGNDAAYLT